MAFARLPAISGSLLCRPKESTRGAVRVAVRPESAFGGSDEYRAAHARDGPGEEVRGQGGGSPGMRAARGARSVGRKAGLSRASRSLMAVPPAAGAYC